MCGINGIFGLEAIRAPALELVQKMNRALAHRGPDAEGTAQFGNLVLGHRRLSIIDLNAESNQPMYAYDKRYCIVYNGELYNFHELRNTLQDYTYKTKSDTEVILAAYHKWGANCVNYFNGMWAFAIWDDEKKELFISRDRLGIKPLYYFKNDASFVFSSELRALLASEIVPKKLNKKSLSDYFRYQTIHAPETIIEDVYMLLPGQNILISDTEINFYAYWNAAENYSEKAASDNYETAKKNTRELLYKAVERRMIADVPFGAFLSGGIDSSAVVAIMSSISRSAVSTFSVVFEESGYSEAKYAEIIAKKYRTQHHEILLKASDMLDILPESLSAMDFPSADGQNSYLVSKATKNAGITMALSGLGGDELFAGYPVFNRMRELSSKQWLQFFPLSIRKISGNIYTKIKPSVKSDKLYEFIRSDYFNPEHIYPLSRKVYTDKIICKLLKQNRPEQNKVKKILLELFPAASKAAKLQSISKISIAEIYTYMQNVLLRDTDQMSMAHALEVRVPFLDYHLVEYVLGLPDSHKQGYQPKKLLTDSLAELLPNEIINRPKMGFTLPWEKWMRKELQSFCEEKITSLSKREFINENEIKKLWKNYLNNDKRLNWSRIWGLVVLEDWLCRNQII